MKSQSKRCANSLLILGHTTSGMGERILCYKMQKLLEKQGASLIEPIIDVIEWMGDEYEKYAKLNYDLADANYSIIEDLGGKKLPSSDILLILSWCFSVAATFATGVHRTRKTIAKLYVHHPNERILPKLYAPADLLLTECLLANKRAMHYGIQPEKILYFPHTYVHYAAPIKKESKKRVIGTVCRLEYGKNCEFAIEAVRQLAEKGEDVVLVLKGDFPDETPYLEYQQQLRKMIETYQNEPWLIWDKKFTPFPDVLKHYLQFDLLLHPSGAEGGSNVVVECLGLSIPCIVLDCSTNPYLFKGLATFVKTKGEICPAQVPFFRPCLEDLIKKLQEESPSVNRKAVQDRFHPDVAKKRLSLLFEPDPAKIKALYHEDCKRYGL